MPCCNDPQYTGNGEKNRGGTDILCLTLFVIFWCIMILIAAFAIVYGNPLRLINGYDSFGNTCGSSNTKFGKLDHSGSDLSDNPYVFFFNVKNIRASMRICVKKCPNENLHTLQDIEQFYNETGSMLCSYGFNFSSEIIQTFLDPNNTLYSPFGPCPMMPVYESFPLLNRCVPKAAREVTTDIVRNLIAYLNTQEAVEQVLSDLYSTWKEILYLALLAFGLSFAMILIIHFFAVKASIFIMVLVSISAVVCTGILWWTYVSIKTELDATPQSELLEESAKNERAFLIYSISATVFTVLLISLVLIMRQRLVTMVEIFREASHCLSELPGLFLQPVLTFIVLLSFIFFWIFVVVCLATATTPGARSILPITGRSEFSEALQTPANETEGLTELNDTRRVIRVAQAPGTPPGESVQPHSGSNESSETWMDPEISAVRQFNISETRGLRENSSIPGTFTLIEFIDPAWVRYFWWVYLIGLVWTAEFILSCQQMVIAGAVALWYFSPGEKKNPITVSMCNLFLYHLGSVAMGSFLITVFKVPRLILGFIKREFGKFDGDNVCVSCCSRCCYCCFYSFEKFLKYINHNAYTVIALEGVNFCPASKVAFETIMNNTLQVATINSIGDFILFLGKCSVVAITGLVGLLYMKHNPHLHLYAVPIFLICVFAYFIAHSVFSLYEMIIDTLFLCYCEDINLNGSSSEPGLIMSESTRAMLFGGGIKGTKRGGDGDGRTEHFQAD